MPKLKIAKAVEPVKVVKKKEVANPNTCVGCGVRINEVQTRHEGKPLCGIPCFNKLVS